MPDYECACCGACCRTFHVFASEEDAEREPRIRSEAVALAEWLRTDERVYRLFPLPFHEACSFLGEGARCDIYATRPDVCRTFAPGNAQCAEARKEQGLAPLGPVIESESADAAKQHAPVEQQPEGPQDARAEEHGRDEVALGQCAAGEEAEADAGGVA